MLDELKAIGFVDELGADHIHFSTHDALLVLGYVQADDREQTALSPGKAAMAAQR